MEKILAELKSLYRAQEDHGLTARTQGRLEQARRYFARAEAYAFAAGMVARELGDRATVLEMDEAESLNFRRATADNAQAPATW